MVVDTTAVDVGFVVANIGVVGVDVAVFQVDAAAASCGVGSGAVLSTGLVLNHIGTEQTNGVA